jgi:hypothetical protein
VRSVVEFLNDSIGYMNTENLNEDLEPGYDLSTLKIRKIGEGRRLLQENGVVLDVDVAKVFPDSESVNQALRFLIRIAKENQLELNKAGFLSGTGFDSKV